MLKPRPAVLGITRKVKKMGAIGPLLLSVASNPAFEAGAISFFQQLAQLLIKHPQSAQNLGREMQNNAQAIVGAMVKGTPVAAHVSAATADAADNAIDAASSAA